MKYMKSYSRFIFERVYWGSIGAGILPVSKKTGRILVGLRSGDVMEPYTWGTFGGKLDIDEGIEETIKTAALRELEEETGFDGHMELVQGYVFKDGKFEYHNYFGVVEDEFTPQLNWENDDAKWFTLNQLKNLSDKHFGLVAFLNESIDILNNIVKNAQPMVDNLESLDKPIGEILFRKPVRKRYKIYAISGKDPSLVNTYLMSDDSDEKIKLNSDNYQDIVLFTEYQDSVYADEIKKNI